MSVPVFRFAPSPNGRLHLGHALSALTNRRMAQGSAGRLLLRVEDIDLARCTPEFERAMLDDLGWLGLRWEQPVRRQSEHFGFYRETLDRLVRDDLVYPAFLSRGEARALISEAEARGQRWPRDPDGVPLYPGSDRALASAARRRRMADGEPYAWRLDVAAATAGIGAPPGWQEYASEDMAAQRTIAADPRDWGDVVLARRDVPASYHLCVVADDAVQGVTHVVRGMDLFAATSVQRLLQTLLGFPEPAYFHHRLVLGPDGRKLSKSFDDTALSAMREAGRTPDDVARAVGL